MSNIDKFYMAFEDMTRFGFRFSKQFIKDISKIVTTGIDDFLIQFRKDFIIDKLSEYNRFEELKLNAKQSKLLGGYSLYRYEYRKSSNLRIIFTIIFNNNYYYALCAFNENGGKKKSKDSYKKNIERAINILLRNEGEEDE